MAMPPSRPPTPVKGDNQGGIDLNNEFLVTCTIKERAGQQDDGWEEPQGGSLHAQLEGTPTKNASQSLAQRTRPPTTSTMPAPKSLATAVATLKVPLAGQPGNGRWSKVESRDGTFIDCVPMPPPGLFQYLEQVHGTPIDVFINSDGAPYISNSHREALDCAGLQIFAPVQSYSVADHPTFEWDSLVGKATLVLLPDYAPFKDDPPFFSHNFFVSAYTTVLKTAKVQSKPTHIYFAYMLCQSPTNECLSPMLDRRIDLIPLASWCKHISFLPMMLLSKGDSELRLTPRTIPSPTPMIIQHLFSGVNPGHIPSVTSHFLHGPVIENVEFGIWAPKNLLVHVRTDCPKILPHDDHQITCALDLIRRLNKLSHAKLTPCRPQSTFNRHQKYCFGQG